MDITEILDGTQPVEVELAGQSITCHIYTAGWAVRATLDQLADIEPLNVKTSKLNAKISEIEAELEHNVPEERRTKMEDELDSLRVQHLKTAARFACAVVPLVVKDAEVNGGPFEYQGLSFHECASKLPAAFLMSVMGKAGELESNPTTPDLSEHGSGAGESQEIDQTETMPA